MFGLGPRRRRVYLSGTVAPPVGAVPLAMLRGPSGASDMGGDLGSTGSGRELQASDHDRRRRDPRSTPIVRMTPAASPHVVIVGGGFGGLHAAKALARAPVAVTVIDRHNHHVFQPLLYQVATAALSPGDIASPIRWVLRRQRNVRVLLAEVIAVDAGRRVLETDAGPVTYDFLILATGATHAYFGHDDWRPHAPGLKTLDDALEMRRRILMAFERAEREADPDARRALLTFVVIGAGPTGVELAGALAEIARHTLVKDFRAIDPASAWIILIEGGPDVLPAFPKSLRVSAAGQLARLGVDVRTGTLVTSVEPDGVRLGGEAVRAATVLWAAGVAASSVGRLLGVPLDRAGRVIVEPDLTVPGHPEIAVIGDLAAFAHDGAPLPGVAPVAVQQGEHAARNIVRALRGLPRRRFRYRNLGNMATIGRGSAVADFGRFRLAGLPAWLAWLFVHIANLIGFRNRLVVMLQWAWAYVTYQRSMRLITGLPRPPSRGADSAGAR
jgi:NADH dehydrogenase